MRASGLNRQKDEENSGGKRGDREKETLIQF